MVWADKMTRREVRRAMRAAAEQQALLLQRWDAEPFAELVEVPSPSEALPAKDPSDPMLPEPLPPEVGFALVEPFDAVVDAPTPDAPLPETAVSELTEPDVLVPELLLALVVPFDALVDVPLPSEAVPANDPSPPVVADPLPPEVGLPLVEPLDALVDPLVWEGMEQTFSSLDAYPGSGSKGASKLFHSPCVDGPVSIRPSLEVNLQLSTLLRHRLSRLS